MPTTKVIPRTREEAEKFRVGQIVQALLDAGFEVAVDNGETPEDELKYETDFDPIMGAIQTVEEEHLRVFHPVSKIDSSVFLVYGNADDGREVVNDHGTDLNYVIDPVMDRWA